MLKKNYLRERQKRDTLKTPASANNLQVSFINNKERGTVTIADLIFQSRRWLVNLKNSDGYWQFALETDTTITSEYILLSHFLSTVDLKREEKLCNYILSKQSFDGGWSIYDGGSFDISASVKAYFALKCAGHGPEEPYMKKAFHLIRKHGGAARVNVFTRIYLALLGQVPWRVVPAMPVEIMLLPRWFFFHMDKVSYWARTIIAPLNIILMKKPVKNIPSERGIRELFLSPPEKLKRLDHLSPGINLKNLFIVLDEFLKRVEPHIPSRLRAQAQTKTVSWILDRMKGPGGLGGIFPAMANSLIMLKILGYEEDCHEWTTAMKAVDDLIIERGQDAFCQPCIGPVWDTCLSLIALLEAGAPPQSKVIQDAVNWLISRQITSVKGDWSKKIPHIAPGGWAFQLENDYYPDVDDTSMVLMALIRAGAYHNDRIHGVIERTITWIVGMQSHDGGWAAFDIDNHYMYLNEIPFADHNALIDPSTADVTARCIEALAMCGYGPQYNPIKRGLDFLRCQQEKNGSWFGRWGVNYIYGTWSVLSAYGALGFDSSYDSCASAVMWLKSVQNNDGGWGESCASYDDPDLAGKGESIPSITSWALLGLMAIGEIDSLAVKRGVNFLISRFCDKGTWDETLFSGTGFPRFFYLRYTGYSQIFPLWALSVYHTMKKGKETIQKYSTLSTAFLEK